MPDAPQGWPWGPRSSHDPPSHALRQASTQAPKHTKKHPNYQGKLLGNLPMWLDELVQKKEFTTHLDNSCRTDNAKADYADGALGWP